METSSLFPIFGEENSRFPLATPPYASTCPPSELLSTYYCTVQFSVSLIFHTRNPKIISLVLTFSCIYCAGTVNNVCIIIWIKDEVRENDFYKYGKESWILMNFKIFPRRALWHFALHYYFKFNEVILFASYTSNTQEGKFMLKSYQCVLKYRKMKFRKYVCKRKILFTREVVTVSDSYMSTLHMG